MKPTSLYSMHTLVVNLKVCWTIFNFIRVNDQPKKFVLIRVNVLRTLSMYMLGTLPDIYVVPMNCAVTLRVIITHPAHFVNKYVRNFPDIYVFSVLSYKKMSVSV